MDGQRDVSLGEGRPSYAAAREPEDTAPRDVPIAKGSAGATSVRSRE